MRKLVPFGEARTFDSRESGRVRTFEIVTPFRPMPPPPAPFARPRGEQHLGNLAIGYYVLGGLTIPVGLVFLTHVAIGIAMVNGSFPDTGANGPPAAFGWLFIGLGLFAMTVCVTMGILTIVAGRCLSQKKRLTFVYVIAGLLCMNMPFGTLLGVLTFVTLSNDDTRSLFGPRT